MENELKDMLVKLIEGQNRLETKVTGLETKVTGLENKVTGLDTKITGLENRVTGLEAKITGLDTKVSGLETKVTGLETKVSGLETEVKKSSVKLENIEKKIDIIVEVQTAQKEQYQRNFEKFLEEQGNKNTLVEASLKTVSDDVVEIKKDIFFHFIH